MMNYSMEYSDKVSVDHYYWYSKMVLAWLASVGGAQYIDPEYI